MRIWFIPTIKLWDRIPVLPVVGVVDSLRPQQNDEAAIRTGQCEGLAQLTRRLAGRYD